MKVEILKEFKHNRDTYYVGEVVIIEDNVAKFWCDAGWAKDLEGNYATGNPGINDTILFVENVSETTIVPNVGE